MLIGLPVLSHTGVDRRKWLKMNWEQLNDNDCSMSTLSSLSKTIGSMDRLMIALQQRADVQDAAENSDLSSASDGDPS